MKDNNAFKISEVPEIKKSRRIARRNFLLRAAECLPGIVVATAAMTLFSLYIAGNFDLMWMEGRALATSGRFIANLLLLGVLYCGVSVNSKATGTVTRDFYIALVVSVIAYVCCLACSSYVHTYLLPLSFTTLVLIILLDKRTTILSTAIVAVTVAIAYLFDSGIGVSGGVGNIISSVVCNFLAAISISFFVDKHFSRFKFIVAAMFAAALAFPFVVFTTLASGNYTIDILWNMLWCYCANVGAVLVFMPFIALFEWIFNIADDFKLSELSSLSMPLLKRLASEAPGTFNHSLVVGNLAEACATAIGENPNLARCAAYYHDIGKLKAPLYFSENQSTYNPHDELIPEVSVSMITSHTIFGEILAKQYRLPPEIAAICRQHHGTTPVSYFYRRAVNLTEEGELSVDNFKYSGPLPQTKVAAIIMIADTVEAAMRSSMPGTKEEFETKVNALVDEKIGLNQFDECPITMGDIEKIKQIITEVLPSVHHGRVSYDKNENKEASN